MSLNTHTWATKQWGHSLINRARICLGLPQLWRQTGHGKAWWVQDSQCRAQFLCVTAKLFLAPQIAPLELRTCHSDQRTASHNSETPVVKTDVYFFFSIDYLYICTIFDCDFIHLVTGTCTLSVSHLHAAQKTLYTDLGQTVQREKLLCVTHKGKV